MYIVKQTFNCTDTVNALWWMMGAQHQAALYLYTRPWIGTHVGAEKTPLVALEVIWQQVSPDIVFVDVDMPS